MRAQNERDRATYRAQYDQNVSAALSKLPQRLRRGAISRARVEYRDRAAVLRPAGNVVAHRDRPLLAVGNRPHAVGIDPARSEIVAHRLGAPGAERDVVFARAAFVRVTLDREGV